MQSFLSPTPSVSDEHKTFEDLRSKKYRFDDEDKVMELRGILDDVELEVSMEYKCLVVAAAQEAFLSKDAKVSKKLFFKGKGLNQGKPIGQIVTGKWLSDSLSKLRRIPSTAEIQPENLHVILLDAIMNFIFDCFVIDTAKKLQTLKIKYDLDWEKSANDVFNFAESKQIDSLTTTSMRTRDYLKKVKSDDSAAVAAAAAPSVQSAPDKSKEEEDRLKKQKSEERKRKMREQQLARFGGKPAASIVPASASLPSARANASSTLPAPQGPPIPAPSVPTVTEAAGDIDPGRRSAATNDWGDREPKDGRMKFQNFEAKFAGTSSEPKEAWDRENARELPSSIQEVAPNRTWSETDTEVYSRNTRRGDHASDPDRHSNRKWASEPSDRSHPQNSGYRANSTHQDRSWASENTDPHRPQSTRDLEPSSQDRNWSEKNHLPRPQDSGYRAQPTPQDRSWDSEPADRYRPQSAGYMAEPTPSGTRYSSFPSQPSSSVVAASNTDSADAWMSNGRLNYNDVSDANTPIARAGRDNQTDARRNVDTHVPYGTKRAQDEYSARSFDRDRKRSRHRDVENRSLASQGFSSDDNAGRGRGRGRTLPAWVTQSEQSDSLAPNRSGGYDAPALNISSQGSRPSNETFPSMEASRGGGRGRTRTVPAWMSQSDQPSGTGDARMEQQYQPSNGTHDGPAAMDRRGGDRNVGADQYGPTYGSRIGHPSMDDGGSGRGRGRGMTLPAWMTKS